MDSSTPDRMVIRRTSPQGDRRRRVVVKDPAGSDEVRSERLKVGQAESELRSGAPRRYTAEALRDEQPRVCDWIPTRYRSLAAWFALPVAAIAGVGGLHLLALETARRWQIELPTLRIDSDRNISQVVAAVLWLLAATCCRQTLRFRRHRVDDYRGRYRVWYPITALAFLLSVDAVTGISQNLLLAGPHLQSALGLPTTSRWLPLLLLIVLSGVATRLAGEIWSCRPAVASLGLGSVLAWSLTLLKTVTSFPSDNDTQQLASSLGHLATAHLFLFAMLLNLRYVFLDAQGELPIREGKARDEANRPSPQANDEPTTKAEATPRSKQVPLDEPPHAARGNTAKQGSNQGAPPVVPSAEDLEEADESDDFEESEGEDFEQTVSMSRSERKRLRKMQQKQKRAA